MVILDSTNSNYVSFPRGKTGPPHERHFWPRIGSVSRKPSAAHRYRTRGIRSLRSKRAGPRGLGEIGQARDGDDPDVVNSALFQKGGWRKISPGLTMSQHFTLLHSFAREYSYIRACMLEACQLWCISGVSPHLLWAECELLTIHQFRAFSAGQKPENAHASVYN